MKTFIRTLLLRAMVWLFAWDPEPQEAASGLALCLIGFWLLLPGSSFAAAPMALHAMAQLLPENSWGVVYCVVGMVKLSALMSGMRALHCGRTETEQAEFQAAYQRTVVWRCWGAFGAILLWTLLASSYVLGAWHTISTPLWSVMAVWAVITYIRLRFGREAAEWLLPRNRESSLEL